MASAIGIDLALASEQKSPRAADDVGQQADVRRGQTQLAQFVPELEQPGLLYVRRDHVLLVGVAHLAKAVAIGQIGDGVELLVSDVAGATPVLLSDSVTAA